MCSLIHTGECKMATSKLEKDGYGARFWGGGGGAYNIFVEKPCMRISLRRPAYTVVGEDKSKMNLREIGCEDINWMELDEDGFH
jgi:hypothetical protein